MKVRRVRMWLTMLRAVLLDSLIGIGLAFSEQAGS